MVTTGILMEMRMDFLAGLSKMRGFIADVLCL